MTKAENGRISILNTTLKNIDIEKTIGSDGGVIKSDNFEYKDFVVDRLTNLEGEFEKTSTAVTYFKRSDLDRTKWRFSYNLIIPVIPPEENIGSEEDEPRIVKTLMLDILRNSDLIDDNEPEINSENITTDSIQIGGFEVFWLGIPRLEIKK